MGKIGEKINDLSGKEIGLTLFAGDESFEIVFNPIAERKLMLNAANYADEKSDKDDNYSYAENMIKYLASACFRDKNGNMVWDSPEDIKVNDVVFSQIQTFMMKHVLGTMVSASNVLTDEETKK